MGTVGFLSEKNMWGIFSVLPTRFLKKLIRLAEGVVCQGMASKELLWAKGQTVEKGTEKTNKRNKLTLAMATHSLSFRFC